MTTLEVPPSPRVPAAPPAAEPGARTPRMVSIAANLMPNEVLVARRARSMKGYVVLGLAGVVLLLTAAYGYSWWQTSSAQSDLKAAQSQTAALLQQQAKFQPLVNAQAAAAKVEQTLGRVMAGDLQWSKLLENVRSQAQHGVTVDGINGTVTVGGSSGTAALGATSGLGVLNQTGQLQIGTLTITGTAPDKNSVAAFVDRLGKVKGLAAAFPASVTGPRGKLSYSVNVILTSEALGGRFILPVATPTGGK
jgi:Tfp pilus assembly protein PilN